MSGFACMECGRKFRTIKAAEKAAFGDSGCPGCGGSDIDLAPAKKMPKTLGACNAAETAKWLAEEGLSS